MALIHLRLLIARECKSAITQLFVPKVLELEIRLDWCENDYYEHFIKGCDKYKEFGIFAAFRNIGIISHCCECKMQFISKAIRSQHMSKYHNQTEVNDWCQRPIA